MNTQVVNEAAKKRGKAAGLIAAVFGVGLLGLIGVRVKDTMANRAALQAELAAKTDTGAGSHAMSIVHPQSVTFRPKVAVSGALSPIQDSDVGFKMGGRLVAIRVKVGDVVKAGEPLASLDASESAAQASAARAAAKAAEVGLDMAKDAEKRTQALFDSNSVPEAERLATTNRRALAEAQLEQARAQANLTSVMVGNSNLAAPFSGLVTRVPNGTGKIVSPGEALFHVEDTSVLKLSATLTESDAELVEVGAEVAIAMAGDPGPQSPRGKVTAVLTSLDPQTRRVPIVAEIPQAAGNGLRAGAFVRGEVLLNREVTALKLPATALKPGSQDEVVVAKDGKAHIARILFSTGEGGALFVRHGISEGDAIVLSPSAETRDGDVVEVAAPKSETASAKPVAP